MPIGAAWARGLACSWLVTGACEGKPSVAKSDASPASSAKAPHSPEPGARGRVLDGPLPITSVIGHPPADVEALVGETLSKGMARDSCVRFVPKRVWFRCQFAMQRYADKTGKFSAIGIEYEDGLATAISFEGPAGSGTFTPENALAFVGLQLPGEPSLETPAENTKLWSWFNSSAQLLINNRQYRVRVSVVGEDWQRSKVEVILNAPLSDDERARVLPAQP